jgi:hypothetical protein
MPARQLLIFVALSLLAVGIVMGAVTAFRRKHSETEVGEPTVHVEADKSTNVEKNKEGAKVEAPGVKIEVPKTPSN